MNKIIFHKIVKARKDYVCLDCGKAINRGDRYESHCAQADNENPHFYKICLKCSDLENSS